MRKAGTSKLPAEEMILRTIQWGQGGGGEDQMGRSPITAPSSGVNPMGTDGRKDVQKRNSACFCICRTSGWAFAVEKAHPEVLQIQKQAKFRFWMSFSSSNNASATRDFQLCKFLRSVSVLYADL